MLAGLSAEPRTDATRGPPLAPPTPAALDTFLAETLRGKAPAVPAGLADGGTSLLDRVTYHGVAGLLTNRAQLDRWPVALAEQVRRLALAHSMWELRHAAVLGTLLERFAAEKIPTLLLKGTALAYDLYANPAERARGDSDLMIRERDLRRARDVLAAAGFDPPSDGDFLPPSLRAQENWGLTSRDGTEHWIDLHWRPLNSPALDRTFTVDAWFEGARGLPRLSPAAFAPGRARMLLHACVHRSVHDCSPYLVGDEAHFGGNRLIWLWDIALLGRALDETEWAQFCQLAKQSGVASACRDGLEAAAARLGPIHPQHVSDALGSNRGSGYLAGGQFKRALLDLMATPGLRLKWRYARARALPDSEFIRGKYPRLRGAPLPLLYARRFIDLLRRRP